MDTLAYTFGGFTPKYEEAKIVILPVAYDSTTSYMPGARFGPREIIDASRFLEFYDTEENVEPYFLGIYTLHEMETNKEGPKVVIEEVKKVVKKVIEDGKFPVIIGGDHSISLGPVLSFYERDIPFTVIQFDAHTDLRDEYEGTRYGHASVARRISEYVNLIQVGIRSTSREEVEFLNTSNNISILKAKEFDLDVLSSLIDKAEEHVYITLDVDVFDPSIIPSVGTPEPGGLNFQEISDALKVITEKKKVIGFDVVELAPIPYLVHPNFTIAKLIYRLIGFIFRG